MKNFAKKPKGNTESSTGATPILTIRGAKKILMFAILAVALFIPFLGKAVGVKLSALYLLGNDGKISGRQGGDVYQSNGRKRRFTIPSLVRNTYTTGIRVALGSFSSSWSAVLSPWNRFAWGRFEMTKMNRFKQNVTIRGKAAYVACSMNNFSVGGGLLNEPLIGASAPDGTNLTQLDIAAGTSQFDLDYLTNTMGNNTLVSATIGQSAGTDRPSQSAFRNIGVIDTSAAGPADLWAIYVAKFGTPVRGSKIFVQCKSIDTSSGLASVVSQFDAVVVA